MFNLEIDKNKMICKKKLSNAEILHRRGPTTKQTHIGLFENSVTLERVKIPSLLIFKNHSYDTLTLMDPITKPDGSKRSPKTRQGRNPDELLFEGKQYVSTYEMINEIIRNDDTNSEIKDFFIIYGTLTNKRLFFILYNNEISDKKLLSKYLNDDEINSRKLIASPYQELHNKLYLASKNLLKSYDLEESVNKSFDAIKKNIPTSRFITKEETDLIHKIGLAGEELINRYLIEKKNNREIKDFYWLSKDQPDADHDFEITDVEGKVKYIEVKTSKSGFETPFYWSMNEIKLFLNYPNNYIIKRISNIFNDQKVTLFSGEKMLSLHNKLNIDGIFFDGSIVFPNKIDIDWKKINLNN